MDVKKLTQVAISWGQFLEDLMKNASEYARLTDFNDVIFFNDLKKIQDPENEKKIILKEIRRRQHIGLQMYLDFVKIVHKEADRRLEATMKNDNKFLNKIIKESRNKLLLQKSENYEKYKKLFDEERKKRFEEGKVTPKEQKDFDDNTEKFLRDMNKEYENEMKVKEEMYLRHMQLDPE